MPSCKEPLVAQYSGRLTRITSINDLLVFVTLVGSSIVLVKQNWSQKSIQGLVVHVQVAFNRHH